MIVYLSNPKNSTRELLQLINNFSKVAGYKLNAYVREADQWSRIEDPEMNPHTHGHLIFDKGAESIQWKIDNLFNKWCWFNWRSA